MTQDEFRTNMSDRFERCLMISQAKNADYAGEGDPFQNFRNSEIVGVPLDQGILVRIMDKISRVSNLRGREGQVADEKVDDTISDAINYLAILGAYYDSIASNADGVQLEGGRKRKS